MKYKALHINKIVAMALVASMMCATPVFAAKTVPATVTTQEETKTVTVLTLEDAIKKAKTHDYTLRDLADTNDYLEETKGDLWDAGLTFKVPTYDYPKWVGTAMHGYYSALRTVETTTKQIRFSEELTNLTAEVTVMNYFASILNTEATLELLEASGDIAKTTYEQGKLKNSLGMLSQYELNKLKADHENQAAVIKQTKLSIEQTYVKLNALMGEKPDAQFQLDYSVDFKPYEMTQSMEQYINNAMTNDLTIKLAEFKVDDAKFAWNLRNGSESKANNTENEMSYDSAKRSLKQTKENKELAIRTAYSNLELSALEHQNLEAALVSAKADYRTAEVNFEAGNITQLTLNAAKMGVTKAQNDLNSFEYSYDMQVFMFKNTSLLGAGGSASGEGK